MAVRRPIQETDGIFFITFTCSQWIDLFRATNSYDVVYNWFDFLKSKNHSVLGYVIMPNHFHALLAFSHAAQSINKIIGNGKRFMAYEIVSRLKDLRNHDLLDALEMNVSPHERIVNNKIHSVFEPSFDWKECWGEWFLLEKLNYIHANPCKGKWNLANEYWQYLHSSAGFYVTGVQGIYTVSHYKEFL